MTEKIMAPHFKPVVLIACLCAAVLVSACSQPQRDAVEQRAAWIVVAEEHLGSSSTEQLLSADEEFAIVLARGSGWMEGMPTGPFRFVVVNVADGEVLLEDGVANGSIRWLDSSRVELTTVPGIISGEEQGSRLGGYTFDCKTGEKTLRR